MHDESYWKQRVDFLETRALESARECARQHVSLGQCLDVLEDVQHEHHEPQAQELIARFELILKPYAAWIQKFQRVEWALKDRVSDGPSTSEVC